jgi:putative NIF3 family GTP cyclohydrolase 1 type 2
MASAQQLLRAFDAPLQPERFKDYGPNGLRPGLEVRSRIGEQDFVFLGMRAQGDAFADTHQLARHVEAKRGVAYIACGHHASERHGAPAVAAHVAGELGIGHEFIEIGNPA